MGWPKGKARGLRPGSRASRLTENEALRCRVAELEAEVARLKGQAIEKLKAVPTIATAASLPVPGPRRLCAKHKRPRCERCGASRALPGSE